MPYNFASSRRRCLRFAAAGPRLRLALYTDSRNLIYTRIGVYLTLDDTFTAYEVK